MKADKQIDGARTESLPGNAAVGLGKTVLHPGVPTHAARHRRETMTIDDLLPLLKGVRRTSRGYMACCPAHDDRCPSLSISDCERGILLYCFAGCELSAVASAIGITVPDLFYDTRSLRGSNATHKPGRRKETRNEADDAARGLVIDALREADYFVKSCSNREISSWSSDVLDAELDALKLAHDILWAEEVSQWV